MRSTRFQVPICTRVPVTHSINTRLRLLPRYFLSLLFANYTHTADQNVTLPASTQHSTAQHSTAQHSTAQHSTAQHSTAQANQLCTTSPWRYQVASCTRSWASAFCLLHISLYSSLRELSGRRQPHAERTPCTARLGDMTIEKIATHR